MTYFGILYWLLPMIRGKGLFSKKVAHVRRPSPGGSAW